MESCSNSVEEVSPSSKPWTHFRINFSSEESCWFIDSSSEETSSGSISASASSNDSPEEESSPSSLSPRNIYLFAAAADSSSATSYLYLLLSLEAIVDRRKRERVRKGREWVVDEKRTTTLIYIASVSGQFEEMPQSWRTMLQIHNSNMSMMSPCPLLG
jgi:hypothetical protein